MDNPSGWLASPPQSCEVARTLGLNAPREPSPATQGTVRYLRSQLPSSMRSSQIAAVARVSWHKLMEGCLFLVRYFHAWRRYEIAVRQLSELSDRELADLRITRLDIRRVAWESPRNRD